MTNNTAIIQCLENALFNERHDAPQALHAYNAGRYCVIEVANNPSKRTTYHWEDGHVLVFVVYGGGE